MLYLVSTPIGNLADITLRALETLKAVDLVYAEDTRHSKPLLAHYQITTVLKSLHEHNEVERVPEIIRQLKAGQNIALISDAGTPLINDPGFTLVRECQRENIQVIPIPGCCALIAALSACGLPTHEFIFAGFLPAKSLARQHHLQVFFDEKRTLIFYESVHRIIKALSDCVAVFGGERQAAIARELTKTFETIKQASLQELLAWLEADSEQQHGEFVLIIAGNTVAAKAVEYQPTLELLLEELPLSQAVKLAVKLTGVNRKVLYDLALQLKNQQES